MTSSTTDITQLARQARELKAKLESLWADEGVEQLNIFIDPETTDILTDIKQLSMDFITQVAQSAD